MKTAAIIFLSLSLSLPYLVASLSILVTHSSPNTLEQRDASICADQCTQCPLGKFEPTWVAYDSDAVAGHYKCHTPPGQTACDSDCTAPDGCAAVINPPPVSFKAQGMYCPVFCIDCPGGYYDITTGFGDTYFKCSMGCSGIKPGGQCIPPIPKTCPIPAPTLGWCGMHITQYQKTPKDPGAKDPGDTNFMFDFKVYDAQNWNIAMISGISIATGMSYAFNVTGLDNGSIRAQARAFDDDPVDLSYGGNSWNTGKHDKNGENPNFSSVGVYATPGTEGKDQAGQREIDTGFLC